MALLCTGKLLNEWMNENLCTAHNHACSQRHLFPPHLIDFQVGCPDQVLLVLGSRDVVEDVVKGPGDDAHQFWTGLDTCKVTTELLTL